MRIAVIIVNYKTPDLVQVCVEAIAHERRSLPGIRVIVADNCSNDGSIDKLREFIGNDQVSEWVELISLPINGGFGWGNNQAILHAVNKYGSFDGFFLINPDATIECGALSALVSAMKSRPDAGAIGSQLVGRDGSLSGSAFRFPTIAREFMRGLGVGAIGRILGIAPSVVDADAENPVDWVTGASVLLRAEALRDAGLFDTGFFLYFEEVELMYRLRRYGWLCYHCAESRAMHIAGASTGVINGQGAQRTAPPDYVYASRKRYFAITGSLHRALFANIAWIVGDSLGIIICWLLPGRKHPNGRSERIALLRTGLAANPNDIQPWPSLMSDPVGAPPGWMKSHEK